VTIAAGVFLSDPSVAQLADLTTAVLSRLPRTVVCGEDAQPVVIERREGEGFVARWQADPPAAGRVVQLRIEDGGVYRISANIARRSSANERRCSW
jgi:hypothetical protein